MTTLLQAVSLRKPVHFPVLDDSPTFLYTLPLASA